jgi:ABC-type uncharacterized transport system ATPase subunit
VIANDDVDFDVRAGEVHALLGENGSGKTTLCKIVTGLYTPDAGEVLVSGEPVRFRSPADAYRAGIFMVHQHFSLVDRMTVAENVVLGWSRRRRLRIDHGKLVAEVAAAAEEFHIDVNPRAHVWQLSVGERQRVEILKALYRGAQTLILDEPTTVLTPQETERLAVSLRAMASAGASVVFISHKLHEVLGVADRLTVLRQGRTTATIDLKAESVDAKTLARLMVGREIQFARRAERSAAVSDETVLEIDDLVANNDFGRPVVHGVSLAVRRGEILGVAGVAGNGQRELAEAISGLRGTVSGSVRLNGRTVPSGNPRAAIDLGIAWIPEDRVHVGLAPGLKVWENIILKSFRTPEVSTGPFVRRGDALARTEELLKRLDVKGTAESRVRQLSGGNAQKVLLARELSSKPVAMVVSAPTVGLDVAATEAVRQFLIDAADAGVAVLLISEDLGELLDLSDRLAVMCKGEVTGIVEPEKASVEEIGLLMMGERAA